MRPAPSVPGCPPAVTLSMSASDMVLPAKTWLLMASETGGNLALGQAIERAAGELGHAAQWAQQNGYPIYQSGTEPKFRKSGNEVKARSITAISPLSTKAKNRREEVVLSSL